MNKTTKTTKTTSKTAKANPSTVSKGTAKSSKKASAPSPAAPSAPSSASAPKGNGAIPAAPAAASAPAKRTRTARPMSDAVKRILPDGYSMTGDSASRIKKDHGPAGWARYNLASAVSRLEVLKEGFSHSNNDAEAKVVEAISKMADQMTSVALNIADDLGGFKEGDFRKGAGVGVKVELKAGDKVELKSTKFAMENGAMVDIMPGDKGLVKQVFPSGISLIEFIRTKDGTTISTAIQNRCVSKA